MFLNILQENAFVGALRPATQVLSTEICKIFKNIYFENNCKSLFTVHEKETANEA